MHFLKKYLFTTLTTEILEETQECQVRGEPHALFSHKQRAGEASLEDGGWENVTLTLLRTQPRRASAGLLNGLKLVEYAFKKMWLCFTILVVFRG